jgi:IclR family acetate operon transcriptional repressor
MEQHMPDQPKRARGRPRALSTPSEQNTIRSLDRALDILKALSQSESVSLTELSSQTEQSPATVYRVLTTLSTHEIVEMDEANQTWHVGPGAFRIGARFLHRNNLHNASRPIMRALMNATDETANLGIEQQDQVLFLAQAETHQSIRAFFSPGSQNPMHSSGIGKALLAHFSEDRVRTITGRIGLARFTDNTITNIDTLLEELAAVRTNGYAFDNEERTTGMRCIASPVFDPYGEPVAGISISGPAFRIPLNAVSELGQKVRNAASKLTTAMGGTQL